MAQIVQCAGTFPSQSTPEFFIGTVGLSPLVTAWEMMAWRFSFSSTMSFCCSVTSASILAVS
ncbi:hypothetical protein CY658_06475 [Variovorax sp. RO1]|nr:hypothetical protein CY658_06475 [Variovorax sp. RO1]